MQQYLEHPTEEALERFLLHQSQEAEIEIVETHILACESCVERLEVLETHIAATKIALAELQRAVYLGDGKKFLSEEYLKALTPLALAIWYMDDGSFQERAKGLQRRTQDGRRRSEICVEALDPTSRIRLLEHLRDAWGISPKMIERAGNAVLQFP